MKKHLYTLAFMSLITVLVITSVEVLSFNKTYYVKKYKELNVAETIGVTDSDLMRATDQLLDYIKGKEKDLDVLVTIDNEEVQMFNQREIDHMVDVQVLMINVLNIRNVLALFVVFVICFSIYTKDIKDLVLLRSSFLAGLLVMGLVLGFIAIYAFIDFDSFWIQFHELLFSNDLWLLDPRTDRLILMVPQAFFSGLVYRILIAVGLIVVSAISCVWALGRRIQHVARRSL